MFQDTLSHSPEGSASGERPVLRPPPIPPPTPVVMPSPVPPPIPVVTDARLNRQGKKGEFRYF